jgi:hypothetical protein
MVVFVEPRLLYSLHLSLRQKFEARKLQHHGFQTNQKQKIDSESGN